jgi:hypothetical protein
MKGGTLMMIGCQCLCICLLGDSNMNVTESPASSAFNVIISSLPAHFRTLFIRELVITMFINMIMRGTSVCGSYFAIEANVMPNEMFRSAR